jgi:D-alanyl-D-alanine dipeptidase
MQLKDGCGDMSAPLSMKNGVPWASRSRLSSARMASGGVSASFRPMMPKSASAADPVKKEGDGKAPAGIFALGTAFGYDSEPLRGLKMPYLNLTHRSNASTTLARSTITIVDRSVVAPDWNSSEHMRSAGESYRWGVVVDHNGTVTGDTNVPEPGGGSCVFLHIWHSRDQGTAGCTAMTQTELETLLTWLDPARKPLLVQLPEPNIRRLSNRWMLPKLSNVSQR